MPSRSNSSIDLETSSISILNFFINRRVPINNCFPSTTDSIPNPGIASNVSELGISIFFSLIPSTIASASGCSEFFSAAPTKRNISSSLNPSATITSVNTGFPFVTVPVLSRITVSNRCVASKCSPPLNKMPYSADLPDPAIIDVGVARPNAHGQAITSTAIIFSSAPPKSPGVTNIIHTANVIIAITTTTGTKIPEI